MFSKSKTAFVFPGQGSQKIGMGKEFLENSITKELFEQADDALGINLTKMMMFGEESDLSLTANTQPALLLTSYAAYKYLESQMDEPLERMCKIVAGHSLGEYSALAVAGVFDFETALKVVRKRGEAMQAAVKDGEGAMAAVLGLTPVDIDSIARNTGCFVANDNSDGQVVLSGTMKAIDDASNLAAEQGAKRIVRLPVSAPFHCPLMQPAAEVMANVLKSVSMADSVVPVVCNVTAEPEVNSQKLRDNLVTQVTGSVRWRESR